MKLTPLAANGKHETRPPAPVQKFMRMDTLAAIRKPLLENPG
jgi:hypothetical protein